jgi:hypothetical protein
MRLSLEFSVSQAPVVRARLSYAFRVFCAIYGHQPVTTSEADVTIQYEGSTCQGSNQSRTLRLPILYRMRSLLSPAPFPTPCETLEEGTVVFYAPQFPGAADWLGEIFEWLSCADEYSCIQHDAVGRVPFDLSYIGRNQLDPSVPYAAIAMRALQLELRKLMPGIALGPECPVVPSRHFVVNTHDVDYFPLNSADSIRRLLKNATISLLLIRQASSAAAQLGLAARVFAGGTDPLDQLDRLAGGELQRHLGASFFFIAHRLHRRDANYSIKEPQVTEAMHSLEDRGMEIGVHGSYTCLEENRALTNEFKMFRELGFNPAGHRQHWLRFTLGRLIGAVEAAGALYDSSLGWSQNIGFRAGACFAFPPYCFENERAANFLEIPLVAMDQALLDRSAIAKVTNLLSNSRKYGWGGISMLWHPSAFGGGQFRAEMGELFWQLADTGTASGDSWVSGRQFLNVIEQRFRQVGFLGNR